MEGVHIPIKIRNNNNVTLKDSIFIDKAHDTFQFYILSYCATRLLI